MDKKKIFLIVILILVVSSGIIYMFISSNNKKFRTPQENMKEMTRALYYGDIESYLNCLTDYEREIAKDEIMNEFGSMEQFSNFYYGDLINELFESGNDLSDLIARCNKLEECLDPYYCFIDDIENVVVIEFDQGIDQGSLPCMKYRYIGGSWLYGGQIICLNDCELHQIIFFEEFNITEKDLEICEENDNLEILEYYDECVLDCLTYDQIYSISSCTY